jgi:hypothetical protein
MSLSRLLRIVPPPHTPLEVGSEEDWSQIEAELGTRLPADYKEFIRCYGTGHFAGFYSVYNPFSLNKHVNLLEQVRTLGKTYSEYRFEPCPLPFPSPGGILPWAGDDNGNYYFWTTGGAPDHWTVAIDEVRGSGYKTFDLRMIEYLLAILEKRIVPLASDYPGPDCFRFRPIRIGET